LPDRSCDILPRDAAGDQADIDDSGQPGFGYGRAPVGCLDADTVLALIDGELPTERSSEIEAHLDGCALCRRLVSESAALPDEPPQPPAMPARLGPYEIRGAIGRGGMGEVYRAHDPRLGRQVAIKVIRPHGRRVRSEDLDWFEREARAAAAISHASVVAVFDVGRHEGVPYVVTELLEGEPLRARIQRGPIAVRHAVAWAAEIARGLAAAHERGIVHRDIKPDNVFITRDGHAKLLDFGVAAMLHAGDGEIEPAGLVVGTLGYMAPEQVRGEAVDHRADLFALGAVLFEMLVGRPAFHRAAGTTRSIEIADASLHDDPFERVAVPPAIAAPIVQVVRRCLEKSPELRFQSARDLAFALELAGGTPRATPVQPGRPRSAVIAAVALVAAALAGGAAVAGWLGRRGAPPAVAVTALDAGSREVLAAREGPGGLYVSATAGDGLGIEGFGALRLLRRTPDGAFVRVPAGDGALLLAANARSLLVLREPERQVDVVYGHLAQIDRDGHDIPIGADPGIVLAADYMPDGRIAVIRHASEVFRVEAPIGHKVYEAREPLLGLRVSPGGAIAFLARNLVDFYWTTRVVTIGGDDHAAQLGEWYEITSVAWSGDDLLVTGSRRELDHGVWRFARAGRARLLWSAPHPLYVTQVGSGTLLVIEQELARHIRAGRPGWGREHDLSVSASSELVDLSLDGRWLSGRDGSDGTRTGTLFVRALDGGDPIVVGRGPGGLISRDGRQVIARTDQPPWRVVATTLAAPGEPVGTRRDVREFDVGDVITLYTAAWRSPTSLVFLARAPIGFGLYEQELDGSPPRRLGAWPGSLTQIGLFRASPDGTAIADHDPDLRPAIIDVATQKVRPLGHDVGGLVVGWSGDGSAVWLSHGSWPIVVTRNTLDGSEAPLLTIPAPEPSSFLEQLRIAGDGQTYAYSYATLRQQLYLLEGIR
jgi:hypothetical protein